MLAATPKVVGEKAAASWKFYLRGLWTSSLRLEESLMLRWDEAPGAIVPDFSGRRPMLRIPAEAEKGKQHRLLPMVPEFAQLLEQVPPEARSGWVFKLQTPGGRPVSRRGSAVGRRVSAIGRKAGVVVERRTDSTKYASAHDLRRAFGFRW